MAYGSMKPGHPADTEKSIKESLKETTDIFLCNMYEDWQLSTNAGGYTDVSRRMIKLIRRELECRNLL